MVSLNKSDIFVPTKTDSHTKLNIMKTELLNQLKADTELLMGNDSVVNFESIGNICFEFEMSTIKQANRLFRLWRRGFRSWTIEKKGRKVKVRMY